MVDLYHLKIIKNQIDMKLNRYVFFTGFILLSLMVLISCNKEPLIEADASFEIENINGLKAGTPVVFNFSGAGDHLTIYMGDEKKEYKNYPQDKGSVVSGSTFSYVYPRGGVFTVTIIASSFGNWAKDSDVDIIEEVINVTDSRTGITDFFIKSLDITGVIDYDASTISFPISSMDDRTNLIARFFTESPDAKVYVNGVEQISDSTAVDFTDPVLYTVVAPDGSEQVFTTQMEIFLPSDEKVLHSFSLSGAEIISAVIDEEAKTVTLAAPAGTNLARARVIGTSSSLSRISIKGKTIASERAKTVDLSSNPTIITVTAEDLSEQDYMLTTTLEE